MGWVGRHWRKLSGWLLVLWGIVHSLISLGGDIDFIVSLVQGIGWVGLVITWLLGAPAWFVLTVVIAGLCLIYWDNRRRAITSISVAPIIAPEGPSERQQASVASAPSASVRFLDLPISEANLGAYMNSSQLVYSAAKQIAEMTGNTLQAGDGHYGLFEHVAALGVKNTRELEETLQREFQIVVRLPHFLMSMTKVRRSDVVSFLTYVMEYRRFSLEESYAFNEKLTATETSLGFIREMRNAIKAIESNLKAQRRRKMLAKKSK